MIFDRFYNWNERWGPQLRPTKSNTKMWNSESQSYNVQNVALLCFNWYVCCFSFLKHFFQLVLLLLLFLFMFVYCCCVNFFLFHLFVYTLFQRFDVDVFSVCKYKGKTYRLGQGFKDDCNTCKCKASGVKCSKKKCKGKKPKGLGTNNTRFIF